MTALGQHLTDYLQLRRSLGHDLADAARLLPGLVEFLDKRGLATVTVPAALEWADQPNAYPGSTVSPRRMTAARGFARYLAGIDPATEVPPLGLLTYPRRWPHPFVFSPADLAAVLDAVRGLTHRRGRRHTQH